MKKLTILLVVLVALLVSSVSYAKVFRPKVEVTQENYIGIVYTKSDEIKLYEIKTASSTCYISYMNNTAGSSMKYVQHSLSCIK